MLYLVATPIGNLEDMTFRAVRTLREVDLIAAEDTRTSGKLLKHFEIDTPQVSFHEHSNDGKIEQLVEKLNTHTIAVITDAGMPGISDPGYRLVRAAIDAGHTVVPIPGANAVTAALVASGLPTDAFLFLGFLPKSQARQTALDAVVDLPYTLVFYESPHRLLKMLGDVLTVLGDRQLCVARELTKLHEELFRGTVTDALVHFEQKGVKGEITVVVAGKQNDTVSWEAADIQAALRDRLAAGQSRKDAASELAQASGWRKRDIYRIGLDE